MFPDNVRVRFNPIEGIFYRVDDGAEMIDVEATNRTECLTCSDVVWPGEYVFIVPETGEVFHNECVEREEEIDVY